MKKMMRTYLLLLAATASLALSGCAATHSHNEMDNGSHGFMLESAPLNQNQSCAHRLRYQK